MSTSLALCPKCSRSLPVNRGICIYCQQLDWQTDLPLGSNFIAPEPVQEPKSLQMARRRMEAEWEKKQEDLTPVAPGPQFMGCASTFLVLLAALFILSLGALFTHPQITDRVLVRDIHGPAMSDRTSSNSSGRP